MGLLERLLPPLDDGAIIELYFARDERAIDETDKKYHKYLFTVSYNILGIKEDSDECINDTYALTWSKIPPERPSSLKAFITVIIRNISINKRRTQRRQKREQTSFEQSFEELEGLIGEVMVERELEASRLSGAINGFLETLDKRKRYIFISRYYMGEPIDRIAQELSLSRSSVNKEIAAIKDELKAALEKEGYKI